MGRAFVVVGEALAVVADLNNSLVEVDKLVGTAGCAVRRAQRSRTTIIINRMQRILREHVLDVGNEQFLVLLLVMNSKNKKRLYLVEQLLVSSRNQIVDVSVDGLTE